jgi:plasmid segregation protein ParM
MRDKTSDDRFYILTLFAVAFEIEAAGDCAQDGSMDVQLLVGLPPAHYGALYEKFERYFTRGPENFRFRGKPYSVNINEVVAFPQAYAAVMPLYPSIMNLSRAIILDIGGFTVDYIQINSGKADLTVCDSLESGVITLYNRIKSKVNSGFDLLLEESDIDAVLKNDRSNIDEAAQLIIHTTARDFVNDLFGSLRERMIDLRTNNTIFTGGGACLLKHWILQSGKVANPVFIDQISANARGYELLYRASRANG